MKDKIKVQKIRSNISKFFICFSESFIYQMDAGRYAVALILIHFILNKRKINGWIEWNMNQLDLCVIFYLNINMSMSMSISMRV